MMKRFLRHAACVAAMLLLTVCPVKALAANVSLPGDVGITPPSGDTGKTNSGESTFGIIQVAKWRYLTVTVNDGETADPLPGIRVQLYRGESAVPIPGFHGTDTEQRTDLTDQNGNIRFRFDKDQNSGYRIKLEQDGFVPYDSAVFDLSDKVNDEEITFEPVYFTVRYHSDWHGTIPEGQETERVRWGTLSKHAPTVITNPDYAFIRWETSDGTWVDLSQWKFKSDLDLYAQFAKQYLVTYKAGYYGYLDGPLQEMVIEGRTPKNVPAPVPNSIQDYYFDKWRIVESRYSRSVDPASTVIMKPTTFKALFEERKPQQVVVETPTSEPNPPASEPETSAPVTDGMGGGRGTGSGKDKGDSQSGNSTVSSPEETQPSGRKETAAISGSEETQPEETVENFPSQASGQMNPDIQRFRLSWLLLMCCLLTLAAGTLRLRVIYRTINRVEHPEDGKGIPKVTGKPIAAEIAAGIVCVILWIIFCVIHTWSLELAFLILWTAILSAVAVLLIRAEHSLRLAAGGKKPEDGSKKPEDGSKKPEDGSQKAEDESQKPEDES